MSEIATLEGIYNSLGLAGHTKESSMSKRSFGRLPPPLALSDIEELGFLGALIPEESQGDPRMGVPAVAGLAAGGGFAFGFLYRVGLNMGSVATAADVAAWNTAHPAPAATDAAATAAYAKLVKPVADQWHPYLDLPWKKLAVAVGSGLVLGRLAWMASPDLAKGVLGAAAAQIGEGAYRMLFTQKKENDDGTANTSYVHDVQGFRGLGYGHTETEEQSLLADAEVLNQDRNLMGLGDVDVSERASGAVAELGSWLQ